MGKIQMIEIKINLFNAKMANSTKKFNQILNYYDNNERKISNSIRRK